jgi:nitrate/nitrite transport system ATP-binding protein
MPILELQNVSKSYRTAKGTREVLRDINLSMDEGEFVCIVGYSGSGKTTLVNLLAGLLAPDSGQMRLRGQPITGPSLDRALIFQNYSLLPWLSALRNVELAVAQCFSGSSPSEITCRARRYLEMVKLSHALDRRPGELSGGMRQRVSLARGLAMEPRILLLDEPMGALDALTRAELQDELVRIQQREKRTVLMITNDVDEAILLGDRIIPLSAGPPATLGEPVAVGLAHPCDRQTLNYDPAYHAARKTVVHYLLTHGPRDVVPSSASGAGVPPAPNGRPAREASIGVRSSASGTPQTLTCVQPRETIAA